MEYQDKTDIRHLFKKCPNCGLIWFRVEACPGATCGSRPSCIFDFFKKSVFRYCFVRDKKKKTFAMERRDRGKAESKPINKTSYD